MKDTDFALEVKEIKKSFFNNPVLLGVSFGIHHGEILGLLGANGAGKSTLMKIVNGIYKMDSGSILVNGKEVTIKQSSDAVKNHIAMVYQEFSLIPTMTITENLFLGREYRKRGLINVESEIKDADEMFKRLGINMDPNAIVGDLSIGNQQLVEIAKAMMKNPEVLILDEPTASLANNEITLLFDFLKQLKSKGIAIILITHHMQEIMQICDRAIVLRGGIVELDAKTSEITINSMIDAMVGKKLSDNAIITKKVVDYKAEPLLSVKHLSWKNKLTDISFDIYPGEVIGIAGLLGSGRTELLKCIYGLYESNEGEIYLHGKKYRHRATPFFSINNRICFVPENRRHDGITAIHSVEYNIMTSVWKKYTHYGLIKSRETGKRTDELIKSLDIKCNNRDQELEKLSGGNQQKVVFGKSIMIQPEIMLLDDPMVGIDVEAKASIAKIIVDIADKGSGILLVSSELDQLGKVCDRILILKGGRISGELKRGKDEMDESAVMQAVQA